MHNSCGNSVVCCPNGAQAGRLAEAARLHRRQPDTWLGFKTVLFALVKSAESSASIKQTVQPIWDAVAKARDPYDRAFAQRFPGQPTGPDFLFEDLDISPRVLNTLETARELAIAARARLEPGAEVKATRLHLGGALLSVRVDAADEIAALGLDVQVLRKALGDHAAAQGESAAVWREILGQEDRLVIGRPINLNSDEPEAVVRADEAWVNDPLAIRPDVEAFGALLASRDLEPPLSIGLFGPWGSGKTTFLRRLMRAVDSHAKEAHDAGKMLSPYVANIVHVEFNAWHYAESALVSSLVDATIRQISAFVQRKPNLGPKGTTKNLEGRVFYLTSELQELLKAQRKAADRIQRRKGMIVQHVFFHDVPTKNGDVGSWSGHPIAPSGFYHAWCVSR
jgi:hypothetical protein